MRIVVHGHEVSVTPEVDSRVAGRVVRGLAGLEGKVGAVTVRLRRVAEEATDLWGCHVVVDLLAGGGLVLGATAPELLVAVDRATEFIGVAIARELERRRRAGHRRAAGAYGQAPPTPGTAPTE